jgi:hypothetical protein
MSWNAEEWLRFRTLEKKVEALMSQESDDIARLTADAAANNQKFLAYQQAQQKLQQTQAQQISALQTQLTALQGQIDPNLHAELTGIASQIEATNAAMDAANPPAPVTPPVTPLLH